MLLDTTKKYTIAEFLKEIGIYIGNNVIFIHQGVQYIAKYNPIDFSINIQIYNNNEEKRTMFDAGISLPRLNTLHPKLRNEAIQIFEEIERNNVIPRCTYALRTFAEQNALYEQGRTRPGQIVTWVQGGWSFHQFGLAIDFCLLHKDKMISWSMTEDLDIDKIPDWLEVINIFKKYGWEWGGDWATNKDYPHLQKPLGMVINKSKNINTALELYNAKKVDSEGYILI